jgi:hypothetical protein
MSRLAIGPNASALKLNEPLAEADRLTAIYAEAVASVAQKALAADAFKMPVAAAHRDLRLLLIGATRDLL